jgi:hypothetical protein
MAVLEERFPDGSRRVGDDDPSSKSSYIVFTPSGDVQLEITGECAEDRALRKNRKQDVSVAYATKRKPVVTVAQVTLSIRDLLPAQGLKCSEELAIVVHSIVHSPDENLSNAALTDLISMIRAARAIALQKWERNGHHAFRLAVMVLAKCLKRAPTRRELQKLIFEDPDNPIHLSANLDQKDRARMVTEWCDSNGFGWLARDKPGRPRKIAD